MCSRLFSARWLFLGFSSHTPFDVPFVVPFSPVLTVPVLSIIVSFPQSSIVLSFIQSLAL
jgi:hypothetical protein